MIGVCFFLAKTAPYTSGALPNGRVRGLIEAGLWGEEVRREELGGYAGRVGPDAAQAWHRGHGQRIRSERWICFRHSVKPLNITKFKDQRGSGFPFPPPRSDVCNGWCQD